MERLGLVRENEPITESEERLIEDIFYILHDYEVKGENKQGVIVKNLKEVILVILKLLPLPSEDEEYNDISLELRAKEEKPHLRTFKFDVDDHVILKRSDHKWLQNYFYQFL